MALAWSKWSYGVHDQTGSVAVLVNGQEEEGGRKDGEEVSFSQNCEVTFSGDDMRSIQQEFGP